MFHPALHPMLIVLSALSLAAPAAAKPEPRPAAGSLPWCVVQYQRADNMWAPFGRPDGNLGTETVTDSPGYKVWFLTDWKYEKLTNDGKRFYGSHLRVATNTGTMNVVLSLKNQFGSTLVTLQPGQTQQFQHDLEWVFCDGTVNRAP